MLGKFNCSFGGIRYDENGNAEITFTVPPKNKWSIQQIVKSLKESIVSGKDLFTVKIDLFREKRSIDQNGYCWLLCQKIAEVINSTKELVYQKFIRDVGQFAIIPLRDDVVEDYIRKWNASGLGAFAEVVSDSKIEGYKNVITYFGSSTYNSREMWILLTEIIIQCHELDIETKTEEELKSLESGGE